MQALNVIPPNSDVIIDATDSKYVHPDVAEIIDDFEIHAAKSGINLEIKGDFHEVKHNTLNVFKTKIGKEVKEKSYLTSILKS